MLPLYVTKDTALLGRPVTGDGVEGIALGTKPACGPVACCRSTHGESTSQQLPRHLITGDHH